MFTKVMASSLPHLLKVYLIVITGAAIYLYTMDVSHHKKPSNDSVKVERNCTPDVYSPLGASMEDPKLIDYIRRNLLHPPSVKPYNLDNPKRIHFSQFNQSIIADKYLKGMKDGFFVEAGAANGEYLSNSLYFERERGWRGLLIEANDITYERLLKKQRKAWSIHCALDFSQNVSEVYLHSSGTHGVMSKLTRVKNKSFKVHSIPLYSILKALDVEVVDFLSLDIESYEVKVLKTLPWDKIKFRLMCIEYPHLREGLPYLMKYITDRGYKLLEVTTIDAWFGWPDLLKQ